MRAEVQPRKRTTSAAAANTSHVDPTCLYTYSGFIRCSGVSKSRIQDARRRGIELATLSVGKRLYVRGADGIAFIERLAAADQSSSEG